MKVDKFLTMDELEAQAAQAIKDNKPVKEWETRSPEPSGTSTGRSVPEVGDPLDFMRVPSTDEAAPCFLWAKWRGILAASTITDNNPTSEQLAAIVGSPSPRKGHAIR